MIKYLFILILTIMNVSNSNAQTETATLGGGCFWCTEAIFKSLKGVISVEPGYSGGHTENPNYKDVCSGETGHAEVVQISFDPQKISFGEILEVFFGTHNPTTENRQGADIGTQYRSVVFYHSPAQKETAEKYIAALNKENVYDKPVVTQVVAFSKFYKAENYHHDYFANNGQQSYCQFTIAPKIKKFKIQFADKLR